jgi:hypothetical protein
MQYRPTPLDFSRQVLVFVHIPKTAGSAICDALFEQLGADRCLVVNDGKVAKIHESRLRKFAWGARKSLRNTALRLRGVDPLLPKGVARSDLMRLLLLEGHYALGDELKVGREPIYLSTVRDPVDRFLSDYYYRIDQRANWPAGKRERHAFWTYDVDRFVDHVYARRAWNEINLQCRYLGGEDNFVAAKRAVDERVFLAAPSNRLNEFLQLLRPVLDLTSTQAPRSNVGTARRAKTPPSAETLAKIRQMVGEDQLLFEYVSRAFDDVCRAATSGPPLVGGAKASEPAIDPGERRSG